MRVLVTGAAGFIGQHVVEACQQSGHDVVLYDQRYGQHLSTISYSHVCYSDAIIHLAAWADVRSNWQGQEHCIYRDNVEGTRALLNAAMTVRTVKRIVFASTCAVFSGSDVRATSPYAASKIAGEAMVQAWSEAHGWEWSIGRFAAVYGWGYRHGHVADFVRQARKTGSVYAISRPDARPGVHVADVAAWCVRQLESTESRVDNLVGGYWSTRNTAELMRVPFAHAEQERGWIGDGSSIDVRPTIAIPTPIADGVRDALQSLGWR